MLRWAFYSPPSDKSDEKLSFSWRKNGQGEILWSFLLQNHNLHQESKTMVFQENVMYQSIALTVANPFWLYWNPDKRPSNVDILPPRWQASQEGTAKSSSTSWNSGYLSRLLVNAGFQTEEETKESLSPDSFLLVTCNGTKKYSSSEKGVWEKKVVIFIEYMQTLHLLLHIRTSTRRWLNSNMYKELEDLLELKRQILMSVHAKLRRQLENLAVFNNESIGFTWRLMSITVLAGGFRTIERFAWFHLLIVGFLFVRLILKFEFASCSTD